MIEYRAVPEESVDTYRQVLDYAFRPEAGPDPDRDEDEPSRVGDRRALFDDDRLVTTAAHHSFTVAVRGRWLDVAGLSAVATRPEDRHRGLVRQLLQESLAEYREREQPFCLLWPFKHAFYRRFGWGRLGEYGRYELDPGLLEPVVEHPRSGGSFSPLTVDDTPALRALDDQFAHGHDLAIRRSDAWYRHRFFHGWRDDPFVFGWYRDDELGGYLRYQVESDGDDSVLTAWDVGAPDRAAMVNLLRFLHGHEAQVDRIRLYGPVDDVLFDLVEDPRAIDVEVHPGPMGRLVDVVTGLEAVPVPADVEGSLRLSVADPLVDWNDTTVTTTASDGEITVEPTPDEPSDAGLPIETLSRLVLGTTTVDRAFSSGELEADDETRDLLTALFPPREVFLREFF